MGEGGNESKLETAEVLLKVELWIIFTSYIYALLEYFFVINVLFLQSNTSSGKEEKGLAIGKPIWSPFLKAGQ